MHDGGRKPELDAHWYDSVTGAPMYVCVCVCVWRCGDYILYVSWTTLPIGRSRDMMTSRRTVVGWAIYFITFLALATASLCSSLDNCLSPLIAEGQKQTVWAEWHRLSHRKSAGQTASFVRQRNWPAWPCRLPGRRVVLMSPIRPSGRVWYGIVVFNVLDTV